MIFVLLLFAFVFGKTLNNHLSPMFYPTCTSDNIGVTRFDLDSRMAFVGHFGRDGQLGSLLFFFFLHNQIA